MTPEQFFIDRVVRVAISMMDAHRVQTGHDPQYISMPAPDLLVCGIPVRFHSVPQHFSVDKDICIHHDFVRAKENDVVYKKL